MKMQRGSPRGEAGQTLLEILIALGISVFILSAIAVIVTSSLSGTQFTKNQNLANQYAQEGLEVMRGIRDSSWINFSAYSSDRYCLSQGETVLPPPLAIGSDCPQNIGIFVREIEINHSSADCPVPASNGTKVTSTVFWADGKCSSGVYCHKVQLPTCLHNINIVPTP